MSKFSDSIIDKELYERAKEKADEKYSHPSAYKSAYIQKSYKDMGGRYKNLHIDKPLKNWFMQKWEDVGHQEYPVYRPTVKYKDTPITVDEIDKKDLKKQIKLKQKIKGTENLPPFKPKKGSQEMKEKMAKLRALKKK